MAKQNQKSKPSKQVATPVNPDPVVPAKKPFQLPNWSAYLIIFLFSCMLYSNTLWNRFAIDDTIVLTDNKFTKKGLPGIKDHFTHDMFEGFFGERGARLVSGGRYRPLSMASLTLEYELMRKIRHDKRDVITDKNIIMSENDPYLNPMLSHGINVLLFALTGLALYYLLTQIIPRKKDTPFYLSLPFIATMLYAAHPIHTEAVANIKGRDEVMCMLLSLLTLIATVKYAKTKNLLHLLWCAVIYFLALLSKENAITLFAVIPLIFYFFTNAKIKDYAFTLGSLVIPVGVFLGLRSLYTHAGLTQDSPEILNNPFLNATPAQHYATAILTFLYYFKLLVFPYPLTHDYYFNQIPYVDFSDPKFLLSVVVNLALLGWAAYGLKKKTIPSFAILYYFITFSVASNILFTVGVLMNERFIYMSSLGFCILLAWLIIKAKDQLKASPNIALGIFLVVMCLYSYDTYARNFDWKDSFTLFRRDVSKSPNSAKIQTSVGGDLTKAADWNMHALKDSGMIKTIINDLSGGSKSESELNAFAALPDTSMRKLLLDSSIAHLHEAIRIYTTHSNAYLLLGNALYKRNHKPEEVIPIYEMAGACRVGGYYDAFYNLGVVYNESGKIEKAKDNLLKAYAAKPEQVECRFLLAQVFAKLNEPDSVTYWLNKGLEAKNQEAGDYYLIGTAFGKVGHNLNEAIVYLDKATQLNPKVELYLEDLGVAYGLAGRYDEAIATSKKLVELNPNYPAAYMNLSISYKNKGDKQLADQYMAKYNQAIASKNAGTADSTTAKN